MKRGIGALISAAAGAAAGAAIAGAVSARRNREKEEMLQKWQAFYAAFDRWLQIRQEGRSLEEYFQRHGYRMVAIYGMRELGEHLYAELKGTSVTVRYIIDRNADAICADVDVVAPDGELEPVDAVIVTAIYYFDEIEEMLGRKMGCPVVSLEDILYGM